MRGQSSHRQAHRGPAVRCSCRSRRLSPGLPAAISNLRAALAHTRRGAEASGAALWRLELQSEKTRARPPHAVPVSESNWAKHKGKKDSVRSVQSLSCVGSLQPHRLQHARPPCPSATPRAYSNSCVSSQCHHPAISSSVTPFSSCPPSIPASGSFPMSQLFTSGGQSIGASALASILPMNIQD